MDEGQLDVVEHDVIAVLKKVAKNQDELSRDSDWTKEIKNGLIELGHRHGFKAYASSCEGSDGGEWLFDVCWLQLENKHIRRVPLILESEWNKAMKGLMDDFPKLVIAKAEHRVMVFQADNEGTMREALEEFHDEIEGNPMTLPEDRYLFACWDINKKEFCFTTRRDLPPVSRTPSP